MTITARRTIGVRRLITRMGAPVDASAVSCGSNRLVGLIYEDQDSRRADPGPLVERYIFYFHALPT
jgi:hypothetical protein